MLINRIALHMTSWSTRCPYLALSGAVIVCALLSLGLINLRIETSVTALLPADTPALERFHTTHDVFGASDLLFIVVEAPPDTTINDDLRTVMEQRVDAIADEIMSWTWLPEGYDQPQAMITQVHGRPDPDIEQALREHLIARTWLFLDDQDIDQLAVLLQPRRIARRLHTPSGSVPLSIQHHDPIGIWPRLYLPFWERANEASDGLRRRNGYLETPSGRHLVVNLQPARGAFDMDYTLRVVELLYELEDRFNNCDDGLTVHVAGTYLIGAADYTEARRSGVTTLVFSLIGILSLFIIAYRSLRLGLLILTCLAPAVVASLGLAAWVMGGELSLVIGAFAAILLGLGVDFIIHMHNAFGWFLAEEPCPEGDCPRQARAAAAIHACERTGRGIIAGAITTVGTFLILTFSNYRGLYEMGVVCGLGLLVILIQVFTAVPAFLTLWGTTRPHTSHLLWRYAQKLLRRPKPWALGLGTVLTVTVILAFSHQPIMRFERDPYRLRPRHDPVFDRMLDLGRMTQLRASGHELLFRGDDEEAIMDAAAMMTRRIEALRGDLELTVTADCQVDYPDAILQVTGLDDAPPELVLGRMELSTPLGPILFTKRLSDGFSGLTDDQGKPVPGVIPAGSTIILRSFVLNRHQVLDAVAGPTRQREILARMADPDHDGPGFDWPGIEQLIAAQDERHHEMFGAFFNDLHDMASRSRAGQPLLPSQLLGTPLEPLIRTILRRHDGHWLLRMPLPFRSYPNHYHSDEIFTLLGLADQGQDSSVTTASGVHIGSSGFPSIVHFMQDSLHRDLSRLTTLAAIVTGLILLIMTRSLADAGRCVITLLGGLVVGLAILQRSGHAWDMMNIAMIPLIIGIGIDNGIHFTTALRHHPRTPSGVIRAMTETGHPILMTSLTTIIGFGSLLLNHYRGIQGVGLTAVIGVGACLLVCMVALPLLALIGTHPSRITLQAMEHKQRATSQDEDDPGQP